MTTDAPPTRREELQKLVCVLDTLLATSARADSQQILDRLTALEEHRTFASGFFSGVDARIDEIVKCRHCTKMIDALAERIQSLEGARTYMSPFFVELDKRLERLEKAAAEPEPKPWSGDGPELKAAYAEAVRKILAQNAAKDEAASVEAPDAEADPILAKILSEYAKCKAVAGFAHTLLGDVRVKIHLSFEKVSAVEPNAEPTP